MQNKIYIEDMGCDSRALDAGRFTKYFLANGFKSINNPKYADYILFITCAFISSKESYAIKRIKQLQEYRGELIVGGCLKGINKEELDKNFQGFSFYTARCEEIDNKFPDFKIKFSDIPDINLVSSKGIGLFIKEYISTIRFDLSYVKRFLSSYKRRVLNKPYFIRISWGCINKHCSFCVIRRAVGNLKSKPLGQCVAEFKRALEKGYNNIVLVGDNVGAWGIDLELAFPDLIEELLKIKGAYNVQIDDFHSRWIVQYADRLVPIFRSGRIKYLKTPLQSASDRILTAMNRGHTISQLRESLCKIKEAFPKLNLCTHIIVGFPSETESEFEETLNFVKEIGFNMVYIFSYSKNPHLKLPADIENLENSEKILKEREHKSVRFFVRNKIAC